MKNFLLILILGLFILSCKKDTPETPKPSNSIAPPTQEIHPVEVNPLWYTMDYHPSQTYIFEEASSSEHNVSYLLVGQNRSFMFDTGSGENPTINGYKIKEQIDSITNTPVTLLLSHFHSDHNQNIEEFNHVAFPEIQYLQNNTSTDSTYVFSAEELLVANTPESTKIQEWIPLNTPIDLGGREIELLSIPGHSPESIAIIDRTHKMAFLGDYLYNDWLFFFNADDFEVGLQTADLLLNETDSTYSLYGAHGSPLVAYEKLNTLKLFLTCIIANDCVGTNSSLFGLPIIQYNYEGMTIVLFQ